MYLLSVKQYTTVLIIQYILLLYDISVNAFAVLAQDQPVDILVLYMQVYTHVHYSLSQIQDLCLIIALTILLGSFFSTYIFRVGLIQLLYSRFRLTLVLCVTYLVLSITLHAWHVTSQWTSTQLYLWNKGFHALYAIHRIVAVIYYYFYKRTALRISDPRLYEGSSWVQKQLNFP